MRIVTFMSKKIVEEDEKWTSLSVKKKTKKWFMEFGEMGESQNALLNRLLKFCEGEGLKRR
jgi:hypothetical protein